MWVVKASLKVMGCGFSWLLVGFGFSWLLVGTQVSELCQNLAL
jgi:hypothetical protein